MMRRSPKRLHLLLAGIASIAVTAAPGLASASADHATQNTQMAATQTAATQATAARAVSARTAAVSGMPNAPIKHVIEIMIENHTFDNLFGSFPGADGIPANTSLLNPNAYYDSAPNVSPVWAGPNEGDVQGAINNSAVGEQMAMDYQPGKGYQMDHYTVFPQDGMSAITEFGPQFDPNQQYLARSYELADHNFQPVIAPTQPNVMTALNGTDHGWVYNNLQPGATQPWNSIFDELTAHNRSWKIYYALPTSILNGTIWDQIIPPGHAADLTTAGQFLTDLSSGSLPDFSFLRPGVGYSTEPAEDVGQGDAWIGQLVNAVAHSQYWDSTAIFVTYDEGGGFWDHVAPPAATGYGTRTPMMIISPYARQGVYHQQTTNVSILSFMQRLWGLAPLTKLNARQNDLMSAFNFRQAPLPVPSVPVAPADTIAFHSTGGILTDIGAPNPGRPLTINLEAETAGLSLDPAANGTVNLTVTPPPGVTVPTGFPSSATLAGGQANITVTFPTAGYYRIAATGPGGSKGWVTVDVGVTPNTAP
ncbi:MAG TPA: alkaline phosphatase family protein [Streptosporangiaceae bacterium]|nr:alkaline phosphatase family protein [Streptosporangiaceae bacterium]